MQHIRILILIVILTFGLTTTVWGFPGGPNIFTWNPLPTIAVGVSALFLILLFRRARTVQATRITTLRTLAIAVTILASAAPGKATQLFSSLGPGDSHLSYGSPVGPFDFWEFEAAASFTAPFDAFLDSIRVPVWHSDGPNEFTVYLAASDGSGLPGTALETFYSVEFLNPVGIVTLTSVENPALVAGQTYWVVMIPGDDDAHGSWFWNNQSAGGGAARERGQAWYTIGGRAPAMEVNGITPVPEPSIVALTGGGLLGVLTLQFVTRRRRNGRYGPVSRG